MIKNIFNNRSLLPVVNFLFLVFMVIGLAFKPVGAEEFGGISGQVTDESGNAIPFVFVELYQIYDGNSFIFIKQTQTDSSGYYEITELLESEYYMKVDGEGFVPQGYPDEIPFNNSSIGSKTAINIVQGEATIIDYQINTVAGGGVSGQVTDKQGKALKNIHVIAYKFEGSFFRHVASTNADKSGNYLLKGIPVTGEYYLQFSGSGYIEQGYPSEFPFNRDEIGSKTAVSVTFGETTAGINMQLDTTSGSISGKVTDSQGIPLTGIFVTAVAIDPVSLKPIGRFVPYDSNSISDSNGNYTVRGIPKTGNYYLGFDDHMENLPHQWYAEENLINTSEAETKIAVHVVFGQDTAGINMKMDGIATTVPKQFSFIDQEDVSLSSVITSSEIRVGGINAASVISITGGEYELNNNGVWLTGNSTMSIYDKVKVRHTSSNLGSTTVDTILTVGGVSDTFSSTTGEEGEYIYPNTTVVTDSNGDALEFVNVAVVPVVNAPPPVSEGVTPPDSIGGRVDISSSTIGLANPAMGYSIVATFTIPTGDPEVFTGYWKYGKEAVGDTDHWYDYGTLAANGDGTGYKITDGGKTLNVYLTDGLRGDDDLEVDGQISDPGLPIIPSVPTLPPVTASSIAKPIPSLSTWGLFLLTLLLGYSAVSRRGFQA